MSTDLEAELAYRTMRTNARLGLDAFGAHDAPMTEAHKALIRREIADMQRRHSQLLMQGNKSSAASMAEYITRLFRKLEAGVTSDASVMVGQYVKIPFATLHGMKQQRGKVTRVLGDGRAEVKGISDGGYYVLREDEIARDQSLRHGGREYYATGKKGKHIASGEASEEYRTDDDRHRLWRTASGKVTEDEEIATDPPVSEQQRKAMYAAASGHSTLGIPKEVGEEFVGKADDAERLKPGTPEWDKYWADYRSGHGKPVATHVGGKPIKRYRGEEEDANDQQNAAGEGPVTASQLEEIFQRMYWLNVRMP